jgi:hypothetical protein
MPDYKCLPFDPGHEDVRAHISAFEYHLGNDRTSKQVLEAFRENRLSPVGHVVKSRSVNDQGKVTMLAVRTGAGNLRMAKFSIEALHDEAFLACEYPSGGCEIFHALPRKVLKIAFSTRYKARAAEIDERVTERVESFTH